MRAWLVLCGMLLTPFYLESGFAEPGSSEQAVMPGLHQRDAEALAAIHSDEQAKGFFLHRLREALSLPNLQPDTGVGSPTKARTSQAQSGSFGESEWMEVGEKLTGELAAGQLATRLLYAANDDASRSSLPAVLKTAGEQYQWLRNSRMRPDLDRAIQLAAVLADWSDSIPEATPASMVEPYDTYLDRTYPELIATERAWSTVAERSGPPGIRERLAEFWKGSRGTELGASEDEKRAIATHYFDTRLQPVLRARLTAAAIRAEATAEQQARMHWSALKAWPEKIRESKGLARLCGTWQWTIHNHQHHQDQKIAMVFPPPDTSSFTGPRPAKTVVLGDAIYLRWEFPGVVQEDSLLFTGEGQRLEGSFVNSSGAWGSITGKRIAACAR